MSHCQATLRCAASTCSRQEEKLRPRGTWRAGRRSARSLGLAPGSVPASSAGCGAVWVCVREKGVSGKPCQRPALLRREPVRVSDPRPPPPGRKALSRRRPEVDPTTPGLEVPQRVVGGSCDPGLEGLQNPLIFPAPHLRLPA